MSDKFVLHQLYILLKRITDDDRLSGTRNSSGEWVVVLANADDVTVITKNQNELDIINEHFQLYEDVSGVK